MMNVFIQVSKEEAKAMADAVKTKWGSMVASAFMNGYLVADVCPDCRRRRALCKDPTHNKPDVIAWNPSLAPYDYDAQFN